ncbi:MAG: DUF3422 family protein [Nitrincola lacisaponensis]|uniref:Membrane-anchored protein n=1 Tax=Nitrincola lacisaponensis TaxID=267850 RepID=A0A063Y1J5_9GAMM|nr:DUF3422 domain-containing protein [Nitrincola lacisaponensis]KDE39005.1 hypothetical protein ADINL_2134 [Nitrincola lacisaponensis]
MTDVLFPLEQHPLRPALYDELHSRPFQVIPCPARITHLALLTTPEQSQAQFEHLCELHQLMGLPEPEEEVRCYEKDFGHFRIRREQHMEFASYTFINLSPAAEDEALFAQTGISPLPDGWLARLQGQAVAAFHLQLQDSDSGPEADIQMIRPAFEGMRLVGSCPQNGSARVWGSFRMHSDGFGRFLVLNHRMSNSQLGRLTQRLLEIETYRLMSLLAVNLARDIAPDLTEMDQQLARITQDLADNNQVDERAILAELTDMAARIEAFRARSTFRFSATRAYHRLVLTRLEELREDEVSGHLTIREFMTRRLTPAVKTCESVGYRLEDLSRRVDRASDMMRTRVELSIQHQNQTLLSSMDKRSQVQLMMQHTVEGLSVVAISYYLVGLLKYLIDAVYGVGIHFDKALVTGAMIPLVVFLVWFSVRRIHYHFMKLAEKKQDLS